MNLDFIQPIGFVAEQNVVLDLSLISADSFLCAKQYSVKQLLYHSWGLA